MKKPLHLTLLAYGFLLLGLGSLHAQQSVNTGGGSATDSGGRVSFSLGQVAYISQSGASGNINQGVQQPLEMFVTTAFEELALDFTATAFPNPTVEELYLEIPDALGKDLSFSMTDAQGRLLRSEKISEPLTRINMSQLAAGTYFITLARQGQLVKTFNVVKNK